MGKFNFSDLKSYIEYGKTASSAGFKFPLLPKYNKTIGNLQRGQTHVISGMASAGVTSFIDQNYVISVLLQWYNTPEDERIPLKIFYYSMATSELKKLQLLLCNYLKLVYDLHIDIPTLNSQIGRLYDLNEDTEVSEAIENATAFFNEVLDNEVLVIKDRLRPPTDIYNDLIGFLDTKGSKTSKTEFEYDADNTDLFTMLIVDTVEDFSADADGFGIISGDAVDEKFKKQLYELKSLYNVASVLSVPSKVGYVRTAKDTEPHRRHLGSYIRIADKAVCIYNPIAEKNVKFYGADEDIYTTQKGNVLLRTWHIVRNNDGIDATYERMLFLPGTSFMVEHDKNEPVEDVSEIINLLDTKTLFFEE